MNLKKKFHWRLYFIGTREGFTEECLLTERTAVCGSLDVVQCLEIRTEPRENWIFFTNIFLCPCHYRRDTARSRRSVRPASQPVKKKKERERPPLRDKYITQRVMLLMLIKRCSAINAIKRLLWLEDEE